MTIFEPNNLCTFCSTLLRQLNDQFVFLFAACFLFSCLAALYRLSLSVMHLFASISYASSGGLILPKTNRFCYCVRSILGTAALMAKICWQVRLVESTLKSRIPLASMQAVAVSIDLQKNIQVQMLIDSSFYLCCLSCIKQNETNKNRNERRNICQVSFKNIEHNLNSSSYKQNHYFLTYFDALKPSYAKDGMLQYRSFLGVKNSCIFRNILLKQLDDSIVFLFAASLFFCSRAANCLFSVQVMRLFASISQSALQIAFCRGLIPFIMALNPCSEQLL